MAGGDARYSDNFVAVAPGVPTRIAVTLAQSMSQTEFKQALKVRSLYDTYSP